MKMQCFQTLFGIDKISNQKVNCENAVHNDRNAILVAYEDNRKCPIMN